MKLLELTREYYPSIGGLEKFVYDRTKIYHELSIDYTIISTDYSTEKSDVQRVGDKVTFLRQYTPYNVVPNLKRYLTDEYDYISVNLLGRYYADYAIRFYSKRKQKIILTPYFAFHTKRFPFIKTFFEKRLFPYLLDRIDALIVFSETEKRYWTTMYHLDPQKIFVIPPYITEQPNDVSYHERQKPFLLYLGRAGNNKKTDLLLRAFLQTKGHDVSLKLTIRQQDVTEGIRTLVLNDHRIELLGFVTESEKNKLLQGCEALVFATTWESFGYVAFEASMFKRPLLCSDLSLLHELLSSDGVIYFQNTVDDISKAIVRFSALSEQQKIYMGNSNYINAKRFTFEASCLYYKKLFSTI